MTKDSAGNVIIGAMAGSMLISTVSHLTNNKDKRYPPTYIVVGGVVATLGLLVAAEAAPDAAAMFAVLVLLANAFGPNGEPFVQALNRLIGAKPAVKAEPTNSYTIRQGKAF